MNIEYKIKNIDNDVIAAINDEIVNSLDNGTDNVVLYADINANNEWIIGLEDFNNYIDIRSNLDVFEIIHIFKYDDYDEGDDYIEYLIEAISYYQ